MASTEKAAVEIFLNALEGTDKPFIYTTGTWLLGNTGDHPADENTPLNPTPLYAISQARTLVTHNRTDFEELVQTYFDSGQIHYGVIFAVRRSLQEIAQRPLAILNQLTSDEMQNQVRYI
ncbi:MAG: hypothetical protein KME23_27935 [Goleter apudmare HA4340-LM2]|jgi:hypothetical protein|nr:hypothetical protein [Goleter apudmare HA4340-LM2]